MKTGVLRKKFLNYFQKHEHTLVKGSSLIPANDPTLLFTNAGMVQFKDTFLGLETRSYTRAVSCQPCVRAGGKHNDLENVGYTARHHTFFEMLGNFSFGSYFKREAIQFAWDFLTQELKLPAERLWITVFNQDQESENIWLNDIGISKNRFSRCSEKDNFWSMGDTGPCGPCTEIYYDHGPEIPGGPPGSKEEEGDRYVEIWNLVFMQYNRDAEGHLSPLPKPSVDTGMGLERVAAVMQGVHSNYEIDIFQNLIKYTAELAKVADLENKSLRVIADHIRACAFLITDGVIPSNEGRGYVLRRICRRAIRHGQGLGMTEPFFYKLVPSLIKEMGEAYPELIKEEKHVEAVLLQEEKQFAKTLDQGLGILEEAILKLPDDTIPGETVFRLYDTYGFPVDLTADIARERNLKIDMDGFSEAMAKQKTRAREASQFSVSYADRIDVPHSTDFSGYELLEEKAKILALYNSQGQSLSTLSEGETGSVVLDTTPFYAEAGGQVGDQGLIALSDNIVFEVHNTIKSGKAHLHQGILKSGNLKIGSSVTASVDQIKRRATALNHSATHLLHAALRKILGAHVQQKGSLVEPQRLRFDYSHSKALTPEELSAVEDLVNHQIQLNSEVQTDIMSVDEALSSGAMALFGEKYDKQVRVLHMGGEFSVELCGGTHVKRTGDIGLFKITQETGISSGIRRIEAITGRKVVDAMQAKIDVLEKEKQELQQKNKKLEKEKQQLQFTIASGSHSTEDLSQQVAKLGNLSLLVKVLPGSDPKILRDMVDKYKDKLKPAVILFATVEDSKLFLAMGSTAPEAPANILLPLIAGKLNAKGGGRPDFAQAGGVITPDQGVDQKQILSTDYLVKVLEDFLRETQEIKVK